MLRLTVRNKALIRGMHQCAVLMKAQKFAMPAMSPTMEKGGVVEWKVKVGEPFSAGDVILEVETDKATIDVEAQDDGKLAKIVADNGAKNIDVGVTIAYIADVEDDLATLELPVEDAKAEKKPAAPKPAAPKPVAPKPVAPKQTEGRKQTSNSSAAVQASASQTLFPSVLMLLEENNISTADALKKIKATGPNGRILKGDVLAYLGKISEDSVTKVADYVKLHEKLDLSNIELRPAEQPKPVVPAKEVVPPLVLSEQITLRVPAHVSHDQLSASIKAYIKECSYLAHEQHLQNDASVLYDPLFEDIIAQNPREPRFKVTYNLVALQPEHSPAPVADIFDLLSSASTSSTTAAAVEATNDTPREYVLNVSAAVNESLPDAKERAESFISKLADLELFQ